MRAVSYRPPVSSERRGTPAVYVCRSTDLSFRETLRRSEEVFASRAEGAGVVVGGRVMPGATMLSASSIGWVTGRQQHFEISEVDRNKRRNINQGLEF